MVTAYSLSRTTGPAVEPVSRAEAKKQLEIASGVTTHDSAIDDFIIQARELVEHDTGYCCITQQYTLSLHKWPKYIKIPVRPIQSVASITYYDTDNAQQTLATTVYGLDAPRRLIYTKYDQEWPSITEQHNGIVVTLTAGYGSTAATVPRLLRQAVLIQVARAFHYREGEPDIPEWDSAYDAIIKRIMRSSYP